MAIWENLSTKQTKRKKNYCSPFINAALCFRQETVNSSCCEHKHSIRVLPPVVYSSCSSRHLCNLLFICFLMIVGQLMYEFGFGAANKFIYRPISYAKKQHTNGMIWYLVIRAARKFWCCDTVSIGSSDACKNLLYAKSPLLV